MTRQEPLFNVPNVVLSLLAIMVLVQLWRGTLATGTDIAVVSNLAFVPGRLTFAFDPVGVMKRVASWGTAQNPGARQQAALAATFLRQGRLALWTPLTYAFLHGGWTHLGLNGIWMVAFGTPVARRFGNQRFLVFMAVAAVGGALAHWVCFPFSFAPVVGASAAISGLMGAAVRFMFQPLDEGMPIHAAEPVGLAGVFRDRRALSFVAVWFITNTLFGVGAESLGLSDAPVAWQAHVGGFIAGLLLFPQFDPERPVETGDAAPNLAPQTSPPEQGARAPSALDEEEPERHQAVDADQK